jgi:hypothetical protein
MIEKDTSTKERLQQESFFTDVQERQLTIQEDLIKYLMTVHTFAMAFTFLLIFLQGFKLFGFNLDQAILNELGYALIVEVIVLFGIIVVSMFLYKRS